MFADDIYVITAELFAGAHQFILSLHVYSIFSANQNNCKILLRLCIYTSDGSFVAQKLLRVADVALSCLQHKKLPRSLKVARKLPSTIYIGLKQPPTFLDRPVQKLVLLSSTWVMEQRDIF